jgi:hypothetical protein
MFFVPLFIGIAIPVALISTFIVKRFHDLGKDGSYFWLLIVPLLNIYVLIGLYLEKGVIGSNQYGDDPVPNTNPSDVLDKLGKSKLARFVIIILLIPLFWLRGEKQQINNQKISNQFANQMVNNLNQNRPVQNTQNTISEPTITQGAPDAQKYVLVDSYAKIVSATTMSGTQNIVFNTPSSVTDEYNLYKTYFASNGLQITRDQLESQYGTAVLYINNVQVIITTPDGVTKVTIVVNP